MTNYINPYYFVPLKENKHKEIKADEETIKKEGFHKKIEGSHHSHSKYAVSANSGRILCKIELITDCVFGGIHEAGSPTRVKNFELNGKLAIPATSLRGMLSSICEVSSGSALRVLENTPYSYRKNFNDSLKKIGIVTKTNDDLYIQELEKPSTIGSADKAKKFFKKHDSSDCQLSKNLMSKIKKDTGKDFKIDQLYSLDSKYHNEFIIDEKDLSSHQKIFSLAEKKISKKPVGYIRTIDLPERNLPQAKNKNKLYNRVAYFLPIKHKIKPIKIPKQVIDNYQLMADERTKATAKEKEDNKKLPFHPLGRNRDEDGKLIVKEGDIVFFSSDSNTKEVTEIAFSAIWRAPVGEGKNPEKIATAHDFFSAMSKDFLPMNPDREFITPAELLFGFTEDCSDSKKDSDKKVNAFKGKVNVSFGRLSKEHSNRNDLEQKELILKILASPKPPSPSMYFGNNGYVSKQELKPLDKKDLEPSGHKPQGVKFYVHHDVNKNENDNNNYQWETANSTENLNQKNKVTPVKAGVEFYFHIDFNNLSEEELGLLFYSLKPTDDFKHKLGMGKSIGLGSINIEPQALFKIDRKSRYDLKKYDFQNRYSEVIKFTDELTDNISDNIPDIYELEEKALRCPIVKGKLNNYRNKSNIKSDEANHKALSTIGKQFDLEENTFISIPLTSENEEKTYEWFVNNDKLKSGNQYLKKVDGENLTKLKSN